MIRKITYTLLCIILGTISLKAQHGDEVSHLLGLTADGIINNAIQGSDSSHQKLISTETYKGGGVLTFKAINDKKVIQYTYYFDKKGNCCGIKTDVALVTTGHELEYLRANYRVIDQHTFYHKKQNLKVIYYFDIPAQTGVFIYSEKQTTIPYKLPEYYHNQ